jgi:hypothetical protein
VFVCSRERPIHYAGADGSDSRVLDSEGRFVPQRFEDMFAKYDAGGKGGLNWDDIQDMVYANMNVREFLHRRVPGCLLAAPASGERLRGMDCRPFGMVGVVAGCRRREGIPVQREGAKLSAQL